MAVVVEEEASQMLDSELSLLHAAESCQTVLSVLPEPSRKWHYVILHCVYLIQIALYNAIALHCICTCGIHWYNQMKIY